MADISVPAATKDVLTAILANNGGRKGVDAQDEQNIDDVLAKTDDEMDDPTRYCLTIPLSNFFDDPTWAATKQAFWEAILAYTTLGAGTAMPSNLDPQTHIVSLTAYVELHQ